MADPSSFSDGVDTGLGNGETAVGSSTPSSTSSLQAMSTTRSTAPHAAGEPTPGPPIPAAASPTTSSIMSIMPVTIASATAVTNPLATSILASPTVLPTNSPTDSTSNEPSVPSTVDSHSKASAGRIIAGVVVALLVIAAIFAVFFVRRNRRKKSAEGLTFDRSYFIQSAVKLDDNEAMNATPRRSLHPAIMSERRSDVVRSPSFSRIDQGQAPWLGQYAGGEEMYGHGMGSSGHPAEDVLQDPQYPSYPSSPGFGAPSDHLWPPTPPGENPFIVPMEDAVAARV